jgi:hypothetical protein
MHIKEYVRMYKNKHDSTILVYTWVFLAIWYTVNSLNFPSYEIRSLALYMLLFCDEKKLHLILYKD